MPITVSHALSATTPNNTAYEINVSRWNETHAVSFVPGSDELIKWASAGASSISSGTLAFGNSNGLTFGMSNGTITGSHNGLTSQSNQAFSAAGGSSAFQTLVFADSNGVSWSNSNGSVVGSVATTYAASNHSHGNPTLALTNLTGTTASNSAGFTLSLSAAAGGGGADGGVGVSAGANSQSNGTVVFSNANGISFGLNASTLTASHNGLTSQSNQAVSGQNGSFTFQTLSLSNANGVSFGTSAGSAITASVAAQTNQTVGLYAVSNTTQSSSATVDARSLSFAGAGAISVGASNGSVVISAAAGAQSNQTAGVYFVGNTTGQSSSSTYDARTLSVDGAGIVSAGWSNGTIRISATQSGQAFSAAGGSSAFQTLGFSNGNGATFTNTNGSVGLSYTVPTQVSAFAVSNTTQSSSGTVPFSSLQFAGAGAASVGISNGSVVISAPSPGAATLTISAVGNTTVNSSGTWANAVSVRGYGVLSVGTSNGSLLLSTPDPVDFTQLSVGFSTQGNTAGNTGLVTGQLLLVGSNNITLSGSTNGGSQTLSIIGAAGGGVTPVVSANNGSYSFTTLSLSNANGISFGTSAGSAITASHNALTSQSNQAFSAQGGSSAFQTLIFTNSNGVSFSNTNGSVWASVAAQTNQTGGIYVTAQSTGQSSSSTYDARSLSIVGDGLISAGWSNGTLRISGTQSNQAASASNGSFTFQTLAFSNANNVTFGTSAGSIITASVAAPGAAAESNAFNLLGANTAGNTTATGSTIGLSGVNLTLSGTNASQIVLSAPATSSLSATGQVSISTNGSTISIGVPSPSTQDGYNPYADLQYQTAQYGNGTIVIDPETFPNCQFDRIVFPIHCSNTSNSSGSHTISVNVGLYSKNASTLSLVTSYQGTTALTHSGTQGSYSNFSGLRLFTFPANGTVTAGRYWIAVGSVTTSGGANASYSHLNVSAGIGSALTGIFGQAATATAQWTLGQGVWSGTSNGMPSSIAFSHISGTSASLAQRQYVIGFAMGTA